MAKLVYEDRMRMVAGTFYALAEAAEFAKTWVPFCKKFNVEPRSPAACLSRTIFIEVFKLSSEFAATR
ncbi:unnamed protein product [Brassica napus]|uniref:(rape) hypothetical protein n=1 Tax=Brassica napus TaxID=3708 RepID=A0A816RX80_BRANA|nr:unnamed protein product [Brassica napus]